LFIIVRSTKKYEKLISAIKLTVLYALVVDILFTQSVVSITQTLSTLIKHKH